MKTKKLLKKLLLTLAIVATVCSGLADVALGTNFTTAESHAADYTYTYYPKCSSSCTSFVDGLKSINVDSSYNNRKSIASINGYTNYSGTAEQNTALLNKLKAGTLIKSRTEVKGTYYPACSSSCTTITQGLDNIGVDSSYAHRKTIAAANNISNYSGTADQNTTMLNLLKKGKLINPDGQTIAVTSVSVSPSTKTINTNGTTKLTATVSPSNATNKAVTWSSGNTNIATVDKNGNVTGKKAGTAYIFAKSNNGKSGYCKVTVTSTVEETSVKLNKSYYELAKNATFTLTATVYPSNATCKSVTWSSDNTSIATVSNKGVVRGLKDGVVKITATTKYGKKAYCQVKVGNGGCVVITNPNYDMTSTSRAKETKPHYVNQAGYRSAAAYNKIINQFAVETNPRFAPGDGKTWCNIFGWDVMYAMDLSASYSHWVKNGAPVKSGTSGASELNANATYNWLKNYGSTYGWTEVNARTAQDKANLGYPTIAVYYNSNGHGHVMVVRPETTSYKFKSDKNQAVCAQAGSSCKNYGYVTTSSSTTKYYWHK